MADEEFMPKRVDGSGATEPPSLTVVQVPEEEDVGGSDSKKRSSSVKFADLNDAKALEASYEEKMNESQPPEPPGPPPITEVNVDFDSIVEPELVNGDPDPVEIQLIQSQPSSPRESMGSSGRRRSLKEDIETGEVTADDIYNEINVARNQNQDPLASQTLHSYIISKTFSSENVVVLLNLRRMKDGEWVLDKTIAQGLTPETEGAVVSIDQYGFSEASINISRSDLTEKKKASSTSNNEITDMLMKIQQYLQSIENRVENLKSQRESCETDGVDIGIGVIAIQEELPQPQLTADCERKAIRYEEMTYLDKFARLLNAFAPEDSEPCNICGYDASDLISQERIMNWIQGVVSAMPLGGFPTPENCNPNSDPYCEGPFTQSRALLEKSELIQKSKEILDQVRSSLLTQSKALLDQMKSSTLLKNTDNSTNFLDGTTPSAQQAGKIVDKAISNVRKEEVLEENIPVPFETVEMGDDDLGSSKPLEATLEMTDLPEMGENGEYDINIEGDQDVENFIKDHQKQ